MWMRRTLCIYLIYYVVSAEDLTKTNSSDSDTSDFSCKVVSGDHIYDLSELALRDKWKHVETLHTGSSGDKKVTYISLCHPLRGVPEFCANNTGVCQSKIIENEGSGSNETSEELFVANGGMVSNGSLTVSDKGWLEYVYENGESCKHRGKDVPRKTHINFLCPPVGSRESAGPVLMSTLTCDMIFAWMTYAACPKTLESSNATACTVKFSNSEHTLNLHTLHSSSYWNATGDHEGKTYRLNFCGAVENDGCKDTSASICEVDDSGEQIVIGTTDDMKLEWASHSGKILDFLTLTYNGPDDYKVNLQMFCDKTAIEPHIYFVDKTGSVYTFSVKTAAVCSPETPHCVIEDRKGNIFDLRNLHKSGSNWEVIDSRNDSQDLLYHINVCGKINADPKNRCPEGQLGACQTSVGASASFNMGLLTSEPVVNADGSITILYTGGDSCKNGKHSRKTRINLSCNLQEFGPAFIEETDSCEYIFSWLTPSACPKNNQIGDNCMVSDPQFGNVYNLNPLRMTTGDYNISDGEHQYLLNLCGPLITSCKGQHHAGVCQIKDETQFIGGNMTSKLTFKDGTLLMNFEGGDGKCNGDQTRSSQILFLCDHEEEENSGLQFLHEDPSCTYHFIWRTKHACPPHKVIDCSVVHDGMKYDLSELSVSNMNEEYFSSDHSKKYVLNVCRSIVHSKDSRCEYNAGACMIDIKHKNETLNLGNVHNGPYVEDGKLMIKYDNGGLCKEDKQKNYETLIEFKCDNDESYPYPQLIAVDNCQVLFEWATPVACPEKTEEQSGNCTVTNPLTGYVFDLNPLRHSAGYRVRDNTDLHIIINVCDDVEATICNATGIGSCSFVDNDQKVVSNAGKANANLHFHQGGLYLTYKEGDKCPNGVSRSTVINFICGAENSHQGPILIQDDLESCTYFFNWHTEAACERRIDCFVDTWDQRFDLTPLIKVHDNYALVNPYKQKETFYINVCRPLNPMVGLNCQAGSSACLVDADNLANPLNLGHPMISPRYGYEDGVLMMYSHGGPCSDNPNINITSKIAFTCHRTYGKGSPEFSMKTDDCQYQFEWKTSLACEEEEPASDDKAQCRIPHKVSQEILDLNILNRNEGYKVVHGQQTFTINVCGEAPGCDGSGVCTTNHTSYGMSSKSDLNWDYDEVKLTYYGGGTCAGALSGHRTTTIWFECDMSAGYGSPIADDFMNTLDCIAAFRWKTNATCMKEVNGGGSKPNQATTQAPAVIPIKPSEPEKPVDPVPEPEPESPSPAEVANHTQSPVPEEGNSPVLTIIAVFVTIFGLLFVAGLLLVKTHRGQYIMNTTKRIFGIKGGQVLLLEDVVV